MVKRNRVGKSGSSEGGAASSDPANGAGGAGVKGAGGEMSVALLTRDIARLDRELVALVNRRVELALALGKLRVEAGASFYDPAAEQAAIDRALAASRGPIGASTLAAMMRELSSGVRSLFSPLRVVYLGPEYSYTHQAAIERFGSAIEAISVGTIAAVFEEVHGKQADFGLAPIENSTDGRIADTLEMFGRLKVKVCGEVQLYIHHYLLGKGQRGDVREVYSKPQALSQCRNWLSKHLPQATQIEMPSTAAAAKLAAEKPGAAAIASRQAGLNYGLDVLAANIEDNPQNITRFVVIGAKEAAPTGDDKTCAMFELAHQAGALADALQVFKRRKLNLTWIESFPMRGARHEYVFFVEFEGHHSDAKVQKALDELKGKTAKLEVLGSYQKTKPIE
jgi:chorismate mutase/prephenate dehydratase